MTGKVPVLNAVMYHTQNAREPCYLLAILAPRIPDRRLHGVLQFTVEERPIHAAHGSFSAFESTFVSPAGRRHGARDGGSRRVGCPSPSGALLVHVRQVAPAAAVAKHGPVLLRERGGDAVDWLPVPDRLGIPRRRVAESSRGKGPTCPAVVDVGKVPFNRVRGGVAVERVSQVDLALHRSDVDVVDRRKVKHHGAKIWQ